MRRKEKVSKRAVSGQESQGFYLVLEDDVTLTEEFVEQLVSIRDSLAYDNLGTLSCMYFNHRLTLKYVFCYNIQIILPRVEYDTIMVSGCDPSMGSHQWVHSKDGQSAKKVGSENSILFKVEAPNISRCTAAYLISHTGAEKLLKYYRLTAPIDFHLNYIGGNEGDNYKGFWSEPWYLFIFIRF